MTYEEFREEMNAYWQFVDDESRRLKDHLYFDRLPALYDKFDPAEREMAAQVLAEWILSGNSRKCYDAKFLIGKYKVTSALPALEKLAGRLAKTDTPIARNELESVRRVIDDLKKP